jgi:uncharacterized membrane-anchored protein YitT (DUF2179 family)
MSFHKGVRSLKKKVISVFIGSLLLGTGINMFLVPYELLDGGIIGIGLIMKYVWGLKVGLTIILLSVPLYILAWVYYRSYFYNSLHGLLVSSFFIDLLSPLRNLAKFPIFFSSVLGGILVGAGIGIMLREETSTGGTDLLAQFLAKWTKINIGILIFMIDGLVLLIGSKIINGQSFLYSLVAVTFVGVTTTLFTLHRTTKMI